MTATHRNVDDPTANVAYKAYMDHRAAGGVEYEAVRAALEATAPLLQIPVDRGGEVSDKAALWDGVMKALSRLRRCELTEVERAAVNACQVATGYVVIEQETAVLSTSSNAAALE